MVIGHEYDGEANRVSYWLSVGGTCALVSGLQLRPADMEECLAREAYHKDSKQSLQEASQDAFNYLDS